MAKLKRLSEDFCIPARDTIEFYGNSSPLFRRVTGNYIDLPGLYDILDRHDPMHVTRIARDMETCLSKSRIWNNMDSSETTDPSWQSYKSLLKGTPDIWPLLSVHPNGYVREFAISSAQTIPNGFTLALLLLRLNDWVPEVRDTAMNTLQHFMTNPSEQPGIQFECVINCLELMLAPDRFERTRGSARNALNELITNQHIATLIRAFILHDKTERAPTFARGIFEIFPRQEFVERCARDAEHPRVRLEAARFIGSHIIAKPFISSPPALIRIMENFLDNPHPVLNRAALDYLIQNPDCDLNQASIIAPFLNRKNTWLIDRAIVLLQRLEHDWRSEFQNRLKTGTLTRAQLLNWQRHGDQSDAELIYDHARQQAKISCVRCLGAAAGMGSDDAVQALREIVRTGSKTRDIRSAALFLRKCNARIDGKSLLRLASLGHDISLKPFVWHCKAMSIFQLTELIADLLRNVPAQPGSLFWHKLEKKLGAAPNAPDASQSQDMIKLMDGFPIAQKRLRRLLQ